MRKIANFWLIFTYPKLDSNLSLVWHTNKGGNVRMCI